MRRVRYKQINNIDKGSPRGKSAHRQSIRSPFGQLIPFTDIAANSSSGSLPPKGETGTGNGSKPPKARKPPDHIRALLDSALDPHVLLRAVRNGKGQVIDFVFAEANEAACLSNGLRREQMVGQCLLQIFPNTKATGLLDLYRRVLKTQQTLDLQDFRYPHDVLGEARWFDIRAVPVGDELAYTWRDVTARHAPGGNGQGHDGESSRPAWFERRKFRNTPADATARITEFQALVRSLLQRKEEQRATISRELHDNIAQVLTAAAARITVAREENIPAWLRKELLDLRDELEAALDDVRSLARNLRPSLLDHCGFAAALEKHAEAFRERTRMNLEIRVEPSATNFLAGENLTHLFRLTQESLQNIEEHSGADRAWINLWQNDGAIHLEIGDNGCGFGPERLAEAKRDGHLGLLGMRERSELLGGSFFCQATPGEGTTIRVTIPPPQTPHQKHNSG